MKTTTDEAATTCPLTAREREVLDTLSGLSTHKEHAYSRAVMRGSTTELASAVVARHGRDWIATHRVAETLKARGLIKSTSEIPGHALYLSLSGEWALSDARKAVLS